MNSVIYTIHGRFSNQDGVAGIEYIKAFLFTKPTARRLVGFKYLKDEFELVFVQTGL